MWHRGGLVLVHYLDGITAAAGAKDHVDSGRRRPSRDPASGTGIIRLRRANTEDKMKNWLRGSLTVVIVFIAFMTWLFRNWKGNNGD
jgi:hypothetical protein